MGNWEREMKNWTDMNVVVYHGNQASRNLLVETEFYFRNNKVDFLFSPLGCHLIFVFNFELG